MRTTPRSVFMSSVLFAVASTCASCSGGTTPATDAAHDTNELATSNQERLILDHLARRVVMPTLRTMATDLAALEDATATLEADPSEANRLLARAAYVTAMDSVERAEVYQIGPAAPVGSTPEAVALRDEYYPWPLVNGCRIDQEMLTDAYSTDALLAAEALNVRGLPTVEYLLWVPNANNTCSPTTSINTDGTWAALGDDEVWARRAAYAHRAARLSRQAADHLVATWEAGYLDRLVTAGAGSSTFPTARAAINAVTDALFYVYEPLLDEKLGIPAGLYTCPTAMCAENVESTLRDRASDADEEGGSLRAIRVNLEAFRAGYLGLDGEVDGPGIDDLLDFVGASELDQRIQDALADAMEAVDAIEGPLVVAVIERNAQVVAAVDAIDALTTLLKTELVTILDLELPMRAEGDND